MPSKTGSQHACRIACSSPYAMTETGQTSLIQSLQRRQLSYLKHIATKTCFLLLDLFGLIIRMLPRKIFLIITPGKKCRSQKLQKMISAIYPKRALQRLGMTIIQLESTLIINAECGRATTQPLSLWTDRLEEFLMNWIKLVSENLQQSSSAVITATILANMGFGRNRTFMRKSHASLS